MKPARRFRHPARPLAGRSLAVALMLVLLGVTLLQAQTPAHGPTQIRTFDQAFSPGPMPAPESQLPPPEIPLPPPPLPPIEDGGDDWSVLTESEIMQGLDGRPADMVAPWREGLAGMVAWGGIGLLLLLGLLARMFYMARKTRSLRPRLHWALWPPLLVFLLPLPVTLPHFFIEADMEVRTRWLEASREPLVLQGSVQHSETGEPLAGVWVRYPWHPTGRYYAGDTSCWMDLILRTDADGRWRVELPPSEFGRFMAERGERDPTPRLYFAGLREDLSSMHGEAARRYGNTPLRMVTDDQDPAARLWMLSSAPGTCQGDWVRAIGPRGAYFRSLLREQRELICAGTNDGKPFSRYGGATALRRFPEHDSYRWERLNGLRAESHEYDRAECVVLMEIGA